MVVTWSWCVGWIEVASLSWVVLIILDLVNITFYHTVSPSSSSRTLECMAWLHTSCELVFQVQCPVSQFGPNSNQHRNIFQTIHLQQANLWTWELKWLFLLENVINLVNPNGKPNFTALDVLVVSAFNPLAVYVKRIFIKSTKKESCSTTNQ